MILLWGLERDAPLARTHAALRDRKAAVTFVDQRAVLDSEITLDVGDTVRGVLRTPDAEIDLGSVSAAYVRPYDAWRIGRAGRAGRDSDETRHALAFDDTLWRWAEVTGARVLNRPGAMAGTSSKPRQAAVIAAHGFRTPDTLVTTDPAAAREFRERHGTVIYKSLSGTRSIVATVTDAHDARLADVAWCPTQFQQHVPGVDYRVHVVGDDVFCARIESPADDYRYATRQGLGISVVPACLPGDWPDRCHALAVDMGFLLAGIDLRRTPDGHWYCFEVNPSPAYTFYDRGGQDIAGAVADLLTAPGGPS